LSLRHCVASMRRRWAGSQRCLWRSLPQCCSAVSWAAGEVDASLVRVERSRRRIDQLVSGLSVLGRHGWATRRRFPVLRRVESSAVWRPLALRRRTAWSQKPGLRTVDWGSRPVVSEGQGYRAPASRLRARPRAPDSGATCFTRLSRSFFAPGQRAACTSVHNAAWASVRECHQTATAYLERDTLRFAIGRTCRATTSPPRMSSSATTRRARTRCSVGMTW